MSNAPTPQDLFRQYVNRRESESPLSADELCSAHPQHAGSLRALIEEYEHLRRDVREDEPPTRPEFAVPSVVGEYELIRELGRGAMGGVVWLAKHLRHSQLVAIKVLPRSLGRRFVERFQRETRTAAQLSHRAVVPVYEQWESESALFLAMRFIDGPSLQTVLANVSGWSPKDRTRENIQGWITGKVAHLLADGGSQSRSKAWAAETSYLDLGLEIFSELSRGLHQAHERDIVHRDVKPANILVDRSLQPYLADFGLAREVGDDATSTFPGFFGTFAYAAPEQLAGRAISPQTDIFSMGATLYEWMILEAPGRDGDGSVSSSVKQSLAALPQDLATVIGRCVETSPQDRYSSAAALAEDLARLRRREPPLAKRIGPIGRCVRVLRRNARRMAWAIGGAASIALGAALFVKASTARLLERDREIWNSRVDVVFAFTNGDLQTSRESIDRALRLSGADPDVLAEASLVETSADRPEKALEYLDRALEKRPGSGDLRRRRAQILDRLKRSDEATAERGNAEALGRGVWDDYFDGSELRRKGQTPEALKAYTHCLIKQPAFIPALSKIIQIDRERDLPLEALELTNRLCPDNTPRGYLGILRGDLRLELHDTDGARKEFDRVLEAPSFSNVRDLVAGLIAAANKDYEVAIAAYSRGIASYPRVSRYLVERAGAYYHLVRFEEAERDYRKYIETGAKNWQGFHNLALLCEQTGRTDEAVEWFDQALRVIPDNLPTIRERCIALKALTQWPELIDAARSAIERFPDEVRIAADGSHAAVKLGRYADALELSSLAERLSESSPLTENPAVSDLLASRGDALFFGTGDYPRALQFYRRAYSADPSANNAERLGQVLRKLGRQEEALDFFQRAKALHDDFRIEQNINVCFQALNRFDDAEAASNRALQLVSADPTAGNCDRAKILRERGRTRMLAQRYFPALEDLVDAWRCYIGDDSFAADAETCALLASDSQAAVLLVRRAAEANNVIDAQPCLALVEAHRGESDAARKVLAACRAGDATSFAVVRQRWIRRLLDSDKPQYQDVRHALAEAVVSLDVEPVLTATAIAVARDVQPTTK